MHYELISDADFASLPLDKRERFLSLEAIARGNLNRLINDDSTLESDRLIRLQYMKIVSSAAKHLGINGIDFPVAADPAGKFDAFLITVSGKATELRLDGINIGDPNSVRISVNGISLIYDQIAILKKTIQKSDISNDTKQRLLARLKELESEIEKPRASFSQIMGVLALVAAGVGGTTSFLADAPQAIATITAIVGNEKQSEEEELKRLGLERPKLLPAPTEDSGNLDDEIPF